MKKKWMPMVIWLTAAAVVVIAVIYALNNLWDKKPVKVVTAQEVAESEIKIPQSKGVTTEDVKALEIFVDSAGVVNLSLFPEDLTASGDSMRLCVIEGALARYTEISGSDVKLSQNMAKTLMKQPLVDYSLSNPGVRNSEGVPTTKIADTSHSQFQIWVEALDDVTNPEVQQSLKTGTGIDIAASSTTPYTEVARVLDQLKMIGRNKFVVMTRLHPDHETSTGEE